MLAPVFLRSSCKALCTILYPTTTFKIIKYPLISVYTRSIVSRGPKPVKAAPGASIAAQAVSMQKTGAKQGEAAKV